MHPPEDYVIIVQKEGAVKAEKLDNQLSDSQDLSSQNSENRSAS